MKVRSASGMVLPSAAALSSYFDVTPRMSGTIIADTTKQTAITR